MPIYKHAILEPFASAFGDSMMALDKSFGGIFIAAAVGAGAMILAPGLLRVARPVVRKALARGIVLVREGRTAVEAAWEDFEDVVAEAMADAEQSLPATASASSVTPFVRPAEKPSASTTAGNADDK